MVKLIEHYKPYMDRIVNAESNEHQHKETELWAHALIAEGESILSDNDPQKVGDFAYRITRITYRWPLENSEDEQRKMLLSGDIIKQLDLIKDKLRKREVELLAPARSKLLSAILSSDVLPKLSDLEAAFPTEHFFQNVHLEQSWVSFFKGEAKVWEVLTIEFIEGWAKHLLPKIEKLSREGFKPVKVLEVGAADGKLSKFLKIALKKLGAAVEFFPVDDLSWVKSNRVNLGNNVIDKDYRQALKDYSPNIVITSWMPPTKDFTVDYRNTDSVKGYILLGQVGATGTPDSWGALIENEEDEVAAYEQFSFNRNKTREQIRNMIALDSDKFVSEIDDFKIIEAPKELKSLQRSLQRDGKFCQTTMREFWRES